MMMKRWNDNSNEKVEKLTEWKYHKQEQSWDDAVTEHNYILEHLDMGCVQTSKTTTTTATKIAFV